jgi:hypothetical protein
MPMTISRLQRRGVVSQQAGAGTDTRRNTDPVPNSSAPKKKSAGRETIKKVCVPREEV